MIEQLQFLLHAMWRIRGVEEEIAKRYPEGKMRCPVHLSIGQEAVPAAIAACARKDDYAVSTHRGHAHYLAKGGDMSAMIAELYGKATGCSGGKGGSMHLIDTAVGFMGTSAIVGNSIPVGVGLALALQAKGSDAVSFVFLGDGAIEEGVFYESVNFAALRKLPVVFVCENNLYSVYSPLSVRQPAGRKLTAMVSALGILTAEADGNDATTCVNLLGHSVKEVRNGQGPVFLEFSTYRWREHCGPFFDNDLGYRSQEEVELWNARDPIARLEKRLESEMGEKWREWRDEILVKCRSECDTAFASAEAAPFPETVTAFQGEYAPA